MDANSLAQRALDACLPLIEWGDRRLQEKSTIIGLAGMAATLGYSTFGANLNSHADLIMMAAGAVSTALAAASTKPRPPELIVAPTVPAPSATSGAPMGAGVDALAASQTQPDPLPLSATADASQAPPAISMEKDMSSIIVQIGDEVLAFLKASGKAVETFVLSEGQKLVAEVKQTYVGTVALNVIQALESQTMSGEEKFAAVVTAVTPLIEKLIASGGISGAIASVEDFAREFVQSAFNDFKADIAKLAGSTTAQAA